ncbi:MAG: PF20097 family protein [Anaerolineae bacterium]|nr:PF20097 family protein [Anaerolineae bacterium]
MRSEENLMCLKCGGEMEAGYITSYTPGGMEIPTWNPGIPKRGWLGTLKLDSRKYIPIRTFRCIQCGFLESFAKEADRGNFKSIEG